MEFELQRFAINTEVKTPGVTFGKLTWLAINEREQLIALHVKGTEYFGGMGLRNYSPSHFIVLKYHRSEKHKQYTSYFIRSLSVLNWPVRRS
jgi:hypothetical protein